MKSDNKTAISVIKKTLGKDGNYYHYESLSAVNNLKDLHWYRIDKAYYEFHIRENKDTALKVDYNDEDEIIYMEYIGKSYPSDLKDNSGCLGAIFFFC